MRNKRFNNVEMLKANSERRFKAPYEYAQAVRLLAEYRAKQPRYPEPDGTVWYADWEQAIN